MIKVIYKYIPCVLENLQLHIYIVAHEFCKVADF
jgi:hypothetical protein